MAQYIPPVTGSGDGATGSTAGPSGEVYPGAGGPAELRERVEDFVRENPVVSLAAALALGYVVGRAVAGITRRF